MYQIETYSQNHPAPPSASQSSTVPQHSVGCSSGQAQFHWGAQETLRHLFPQWAFMSWARSLISVEAPTDTALKRSLPVQDPPEEWDFPEGQRSLWQRTWEQVWWISTHTSCHLKKEAGDKTWRGQMSVNLISSQAYPLLSWALGQLGFSFAIYVS